MMFKQALLATAAVVLLAVPSVSLAQNNQGNPAEPEKKGEHPAEQGKGEQGKPQGQPHPQGQPGPQGHAQPQGQPGPQGQPHPQPQARHQAPPPPQGQPHPNGQAQAPAEARHQAPPPPHGQPRPEGQFDHQAQARPQNQPGPQGGERDHRAPAAVHVEQRDQWRSGHADWNRETVWSRDRNWWHENAGFREYRGARPNFFFAPGYGYYSVPREYWGLRWAVGAFLPAFFLSYAVADYREYGLPEPPDGCEWVWVNNNVLLVDRSDGYVVDEIDNVW